MRVLDRKAKLGTADGISSRLQSAQNCNFGAGLLRNIFSFSIDYKLFNDMPFQLTEFCTNLFWFYEDFSQEKLAQFLLSQMKTLKMVSIYKAHAEYEEVYKAIFKLENLKYLGKNFPTNTRFYEELNVLESLEKIQTHRGGYEIEVFENIIQKCPNIKTLRLLTTT